jgi:hypothetical protein
MGKQRRRKPPGTKPEPEPPKRDREIPDPSTVVEEFSIQTPKGHRYRVLRTNQKDPSDPPDGPDT